MASLHRIALCLALLAQTSHGVAQTSHGADISSQYEGDEELDKYDPSGMKDLFQNMDEDEDGYVTMREILEFGKHTRQAMSFNEVGEYLDESDTNKDGKVSLDEHLRAQEQNPSEDQHTQDEARQLETKKFEVADLDQDGLADKAELAALLYPEAHPETLEFVTEHAIETKDRNNDGTLNLKEFWDTEDDETAEEQDDSFKLLDLDGNGQLNHAELKHWESGTFYTEMAMKEFMQIVDTNKDGKVTIKELEANMHHPKVVNSEAASHFMDWIGHHSGDIEPSDEDL